MDYKYAFADKSQPPSNPPYENRHEYVDTQKLVNQLNGLFEWCEKEIIAAKEILSEIDKIFPSLSKESIEYKQTMELRSLIQKNLERTYDEKKVNATELHFLVSETLEYLSDKKLLANQIMKVLIANL